MRWALNSWETVLKVEVGTASDSNRFGLRHFNPIAYETDASVSSKIGFV